MASSSPSEPRRRSGRSLVGRLTVGLVLAVVLLGLTVASLAVWQYWRTTVDSIDHRLLEAAEALAGRIVVTNGLLEIELDTGTALVGDDQEDPAVYSAVYDADGRLLYRSSSVAPEQSDASAGFRSLGGFREVAVTGPSGSIVVVGESLEPAYADIRRLAASLSLATLVGAGLTLPVAIWLRRQLARSLQHIDQTARALAPGQPLRIEQASVADEFGGVATALNSAFDRLDEALARERQITSDASHELRTPATTLLAEAHWALDRPRDAATYRRSLEVCVRQAARMKDLVESLLTLARLEAGTMPPQRTAVALGPLVDETMAELQPMAAQHQVTLQHEGDALVAADRVQMRILVTNLVTNAIRYNRPRGDVRVVVGEAPGGAVLRVSDSGHGLPREVAARVFERFWRADAGRSPRVGGGTGLGLAIVKAIVDAHGGRIAVESEPGRGTTFTVELARSDDVAIPG